MTGEPMSYSSVTAARWIWHHGCDIRPAVRPGGSLTVRPPPPGLGQESGRSSHLPSGGVAPQADQGVAKQLSSPRRVCHTDWREPRRGTARRAASIRAAVRADPRPASHPSTLSRPVCDARCPPAPPVTLVRLGGGLRSLKLCRTLPDRASAAQPAVLITILTLLIRYLYT